MKIVLLFSSDKTVDEGTGASPWFQTSTMDTAGILAELLNFATNVLSAQYDVKCTCGSRHCRCGSISQANASPSMSC